MIYATFWDWLNGVGAWFITAWDWLVNAFKTIDYWINRPIPVIGITGATLIAMAWFIFKNTTFGKRNLLKLKKGYTELVDKFETFKNETKENEVKIKEFYESQLSIAQTQLHEAQTLVEIVANNSHNQKVKNALSNYKTHLELVNTNYDEFLKQREEQLKKEYENKYALELETLRKSFNDLKDEFNKLLYDQNAAKELEQLEQEEKVEVVEDGE